jgi:hypothetical protein
LGPAFYGLNSTLLTFLFMALLRVKHPENMKEFNPVEFGRLLGLDRAPEVKTLRHKLGLLADESKAEPFLKELMQQRIATREEALGYLYVDGHVRVYSGKRRIPKTHSARMRIALPATQDIWVNDAEGEPVFVITQEAHPSLVTALTQVADSVRAELGERRLTFVFDRGGWSSALFQRLQERGFDIITYRKGDKQREPIPEQDFTLVPDERHPEGSWRLHDASISFELRGGPFELRQVTVLTERGRQIAIVTTDRALAAAEVAHRMLHRWQQENFFKYMRQEFALDALVDYGVQEQDPERSFPNPKYREAHKRYRAAVAATQRAAAAYGEAIAAGDTRHARLRKQLQRCQERQQKAKDERDALDRRLRVQDFPDEERPQRLRPHRKLLSDGLKMLAYQVESDLVRLVRASYRRSDDEGRTLIAAALQSTGSLLVEGRNLYVTLLPQSSPHRTRALAELCQLLNETQTCFPGTDLRLHYAIRGERR